MHFMRKKYRTLSTALLAAAIISQASAQGYHFDFGAYGIETNGNTSTVYSATDTLGSGVSVDLSFTVSNTPFDYSWILRDAGLFPSDPPFQGHLTPPGGYSGIVTPIIEIGDNAFENQLTTIIRFSSPIDIILDFGDIDLLDRFQLSVAEGSFTSEKLWEDADITISDYGPSSYSSFTAGDYQLDGMFADDLIGSASLYEGVRVTFTGVQTITAIWDGAKIDARSEGGVIYFPSGVVPEPSSFAMVAAAGVSLCTRRNRRK